MLTAYRIRQVHRIIPFAKRSLLQVPTKLARSSYDLSFRQASSNSKDAEASPPLPSVDPLYQRLQEAYLDYKHKQNPTRGEEATVSANDKGAFPDSFNVQSSPLQVDVTRENISWVNQEGEEIAFDPVESFEEDGHCAWADLETDAGDPFECDDTHMRQVKAESKYAWVSQPSSHYTAFESLEC